jgi:uncharacterized membrane protein YesL
VVDRVQTIRRTVMTMHVLRVGLWVVLFAAGLPIAGAAPAEVTDN